MIPHTFTYERAVSPEHAMELLRGDTEAKLVAGGHSLIPLMKMRLASPSKLVDISGLPELRGIKLEGRHIVVGALSTHRDVATNPLINTYLPALAEAASQVGDLQVRNRGTIGGNLAHADPASDLPAVALAYDAALTVLGSEGTETLFSEDFFLGPLLTALPEGNLILSISFGVPPAGAKSTYVKYAHPASGYAVVGIAAVVGADENQIVNYARISITGAADVAYRARACEHALIGKPLTEESIQYASEFAPDDGEIAGDLFAGEAYRRHLCTVFTARALKRLV
jgi:aerobic carbon-monoxide dehydrogenase medium subunit